MGYRVGFQCFETEQSATDYKMSLVAPAVTADGKLFYPVKKNNVWTFAGQPVRLSHGYCDPMKDYAQGFMISSAFIGLFVLVYSIRIAVKAISMIGSEYEQED